MAEGDSVVYNSFKDRVLQGTFNLATGGDTVQVTLHNAYTPDIDNHSVRADVSSTEYGSGSGYTLGGITLANQTVTKDNVNDRAAFNADDVVWAALGPLTPGIPSHAIIFDDTPASPLDPLIMYIELGVTATNGENYTLQWGTAGILLVS